MRDENNFIFSEKFLLNYADSLKLLQALRTKNVREVTALRDKLVIIIFLWFRSQFFFFKVIVCTCCRCHCNFLVLIDDSCGNIFPLSGTQEEEYCSNFDTDTACALYTATLGSNCNDFCEERSSTCEGAVDNEFLNCYAADVQEECCSASTETSCGQNLADVICLCSKPSNKKYVTYKIIIVN